MRLALQLRWRPAAAALLVLACSLLPVSGRAAPSLAHPDAADEACFASFTESTSLSTIPGRTIRPADPASARAIETDRLALPMRALRPAWGNSTLSRVCAPPLQCLDETSNSRMASLCIRHV